jgi:hypothetical protein
MAAAGGAPPLPVPATDPSEVGRRADEILARPEFQPDPTGLVERGFEALGDAVGGLLDALFTGGGSSLVAWAILVLVGGLTAFLVIRLGRTVQRSPQQEVGAASSTARPPSDWLAEAERLEAIGAWRDGLRCRYRALVGDLIDRRLVVDVPGRTAGEYRRDVAEAAPAASGEFAGATELFERAWYGDRSTGADESARFRALADRVLDEAAR